MKILVTGGAGYIGSHACKELAQSGYAPIAFDNLVYGHPWAVKWGPLEKGNLADTARLIEVIRKHGVQAVIHFAAFAFVGESVQKPEIYYQNNVGGSLSLLEAMRITGLKNIVFSSTCATYGTPVQVPIPESHPQNPINPYGMTKWMVEKMLQDFKTAHGFRSISLRYFNASGADESGEIGEAHEPETHLIPLAIEAALGKRGPLTLFGSDYETPDGTCIRDYIHVTDLARAHVLALQVLEKGNPERPAYNLGTGTGYSNKEVIASVERVTGKKVPVIAGPRRAGDPPRLVADSQNAFRELGWKPQYQQLDEVVRTAVRWHDRSK